MRTIHLGLPGLGVVLAAMLSAAAPAPVVASDHLDTPSVIAKPEADIADLYAWTSSDGRRLNLTMTIVADQFSDRLDYVFHVDSGARFGATAATTAVVCRFDGAGIAECWAGDADYLRGDAGGAAGFEGRKGRFRVFAGLRDDPFFNNVKGTRAALAAAFATLPAAAPADAAGCSALGSATSRTVFELWKRTEGGPATNFVAGWKSASLVVAVDLELVNGGGKLLAVWGAVHGREDGGVASGQAPPPCDESVLFPARVGCQPRGAGAAETVPPRPSLGPAIDRAGRALTENALIALLAPADVSAQRKETYNRTEPAEWPRLAADIEVGLGLYDGFDGVCGNQWAADRRGPPAARYRALARLLADDRLWVDSTATTCERYLAVELTELELPGTRGGDCGGRTPIEDATDVFRSLLVLGGVAGVDDGVGRDDASHSTTDFPFLAKP